MSVAPRDLAFDSTDYVDLLRRRASEHGDSRGFTYLPDDDSAPVVYSFRSLDRKARAIAARLQAGGLAGQVAVLLYPPGLEFLPAFFGCLYAGVIPAPAYPPRPRRPSPRLQTLFADSRARLILGQASLFEDLDARVDPSLALEGLTRLATDRVLDEEAEAWSRQDIRPESVAFLQYTSGSTARPKGVVITHANLVANSRSIRRSFGSESDSTGVFWLPLYHDMGLIGGILQTIFCGGSSTLFAPAAFLQRPHRWLELIARTGASISGAPNFAYDLCTRKVSEEQKDSLDLSRWQVAFNGAEPIHPETIERFAGAFARCGFRPEAFLPCYGLAESTLLIAGGRPAKDPVILDFQAQGLAENRAVDARPGEPDARRLVGSGQIDPDYSVVIVDPESAVPLPDGVLGEIWVQGPSVAAGYWNQPEATLATFGARLADPDRGPFLRSGDLGFFREGELFVAGRIKDLIIIRGRNVYPQDVEWTVGRCHPSLAPESSAVFTVEVDGDSRLVVVQEAGRREKDHAAVLAAIRTAVAVEHELELHAVVLLKPWTLPKTTSGKVQRHQARQSYLDGTLSLVGSWTSGTATISIEPAAGDRAGSSRTRAEVEAWLATRLAGPLGIRAEEIDIRKPFAEFGLGSLRAVELAAEMEGWLGRDLAPTLLYDHPTIEALALALTGELGLSSRPIPGPDRDDRVAIVGIGCRFPGASGPDAFWKLLEDGVDAVGQVPEGRLADFGGPATTRGGFLDRVDRFDAEFFGISPREAAQVDPQQRLLLEVAWEAFEDAGLVADRLAGGRVGVFVGISTNDYGRLRADVDPEDHVYTLTGNAGSIAANRISYAFDLRGPSLAIDTACSSSLVAIHQACRSLATGESDLALAGGVNLTLDPEVLGRLGSAGFLAADGRCKPFDASADGYVRGEGAALIALKPLASALADGDPIYAVIRGGAVNQDGRSNGLTAPSGEAQEAVLRDAYRASGVDPARVGYVEAHGTGTLLGDPIEARALGRVMAPGRPDGGRCLIGSVKANIGHLEAAAGVAGVIKVALALRRSTIPASLNFLEANPRIPFGELGLAVARERSDWPAPTANRLAGVSSFGFGGTNAHLVLESLDPGPVERPEIAPSAVLLPISARSPEALRDLARSYRGSLAAGGSLPDLAFSAARNRAELEHRLAVVAGSSDVALASLDAFDAGRSRASVASGRKAPGRRRRLAFVFSGQGGQWVGMALDLLATEPSFRGAFDEVDRLVREIGGWSPRAELEAPAGSSRIFEPEYAQPVQFAIHLALAALWRSWGIEPDAVLGHSLGEISAACLAGALTPEDATRLVLHRGRLTQRELGQGRTLAAGLGPVEAARIVAESEGRLAIAAFNGPRSSALSGDPDAIADLATALESRGIFAKALEVAVAYHGPKMEPLRIELEAAIAGLAAQAASIPWISTVTGRPIEGRGPTAIHWGRNLRDVVRFSDAVEHLADQGFDTFLEIGPHPSLLGSIREAFEDRGVEALAVGSLRRGLDGRATLLRSLASLFARGWSVARADVAPSGRSVRLPLYPWQGGRHWAATRARSISDGETKPQAPIMVGASNRGLRDLCHEVAWVPVASRDPLVPVGEPGRWLIFEDGSGVGRAIRARLESSGADCVSVAPEGFLDLDLAQILDDPRLRGVVSCRPLDAMVSDETPIEEIESVLANGCDSTLTLARRMSGLRSGARLWLVTAGAQPAGPTPSVANPSQGTYWGLGRSLALMDAKVWGGMVDLDRDDPLGDLEAVVARFLGADGEDQLAFREGVAYAARLVRSTFDPAPAVDLRPDGTYLVTGGLGELGSRAATWLVERGARRVVLLGRRGLPSRAMWDGLTADHPASQVVGTIRSMERLGATVVVEAVDLADERSMAALFSRLEGMLPPIRGVIHAAGILEAGTGQDGSARAVLRPKVAGTWVLHRLTRHLPLDFFASFSSAAGAFGAKDAAYAAANAFLDGFARWSGGLSVGWGPWASGGMAVERARAHRLLGLRPLDADRAFGLLGGILGGTTRHLVAADFDWPAFRKVAEAGGRGRILAAIEEPPSVIGRTSMGSFRELRRGRPAEVRREGIVLYFRDRVAEVLHLDPERVDPDRPLDAMGLDSLMAIELKGRVEADLGTDLPLTSLLDGPTIRRLADSTAERWDDPDLIEAAAIAAEPPGDSGDEHPLSPGQRALWTLHRRMPDDPSYNMAGAARIRARIDREALRRSIQALVDRHASLRTRFVEVDGSPTQRVEAGGVAAFRIEDASSCSSEGLEARIAEEARRPFDLEVAPPFRTTLFATADDDQTLVLSAHHIVGDFWSIAILLEELGPIYRAEVDGARAELPDLPVRYVDFARWQASMLAGPEGDRLRDYWGGQLSGALPVLDLPTDHPRPVVRGHRGGSRTTRIGRELAGRVAELASSRGASLYVASLAAFQVLLGRLSDRDDLIVGSPVAARGHAGLGGVVGYFANPLPIRVDLSGRPSFGVVLDRGRRAVFHGLDHQDLPFAEMVDRFVKDRSPGRSPLFQVLFAFQKAQRLDAEGLTPFILREAGAKLDLDGLPMESVAIDLGASQFDLALSVVEVDGGLAVSLEYSSELFEPATIDRMLERYRTLLRSVVDHPDRPIADLEILPEAEKSLVLDAWNATDAPYPAGTPVHRLIEAEAARRPDAVAVAFAGRLLTYRDLNERANRLARTLRGLGVGPESRVGLGVERSDGMIVGILGILKAGGAYVPLDPGYPAERLEFLRDDAAIDVLVVHREVEGRIPSGPARVVRLDEAAGGDDANLGGGAGPDHAAYVIYTSGSTGRPKGVTVSHRNLAQSTAARADYYPDRYESFLLLASFAHDTSVAGIFGTLCRGGMLVIPRQGEHTDPEVLSGLIEEHRISHANTVPSLFRVILAESPTERLRSLRCLFLGGEACPPDLPAAIRAKLPSLEVHNEYGPTETTVWCTVHECTAGDGDGPIPIGRPISNARTYVLDDRLGPAAIGAAGELYIGGEGVARGYLGRPALTAERFVPDPFGPRPGGRLYRTGDLARWRHDGRLEFLGRLDHQVKIRGYRIELAEVEAALLKHPEVQDAVAVARPFSPGDNRLIAYVIPIEGAVPTPGELRRWLKRRLPDSHVPSYFHPLATFPVSPNGKLDRSALPAPGVEASADQGPLEKPRNRAERLVARVAAEVLARARVGIHDDFFDLGIDSILAIQLVSKLRQSGLKVDPSQVFEHPTVAALAALADPGIGADKGPEPADDSPPEYPASPMQEGMLFHSGQSPDSGVYVQQFTCPIDRALDLDAFEAAWKRIVDRHPVLRTAFLAGASGRIRQVVRDEVELPFRVIDWIGIEPARVDDRLEDYLRDDRRAGFDPTVAPLLRLALIRTGPETSRLVLSNHHALMDGWCVPILLGEILIAYEAAVDGLDVELPAVRPYSDYIRWLGSLDGAKAEEFWRQTLRDVRSATPLPFDAPSRTKGLEGEAGVRRAWLDAGTTAGLARMARSRRLTLGTVVQGAWALLLARYSGRSDVVFGVTVSGRPAELAGSTSMVGLFINTLPARVRVDESLPLADWLSQVQAGLLAIRRHETTPLAQIQGWSDLPPGRTLFESLVVFENYPDDPGARGRAERLGVGEILALERTNYPLALAVVPGARLALSVGFDLGRFSGSAVDQLLTHLSRLLAAMADGPDRRLAEFHPEDSGGTATVGRRAPGLDDLELHPTQLDGLSDEEVEAMLVELTSEGGIAR